MIFRSQFFAVSGYQLILVSPESIDFTSIILNFDEKLADSYVVLSVHTGMIGLFFIALIILRRIDRNDRQKVILANYCYFLMVLKKQRKKFNFAKFVDWLVFHLNCILTLYCTRINCTQLK